MSGRRKNALLVVAALISSAVAGVLIGLVHVAVTDTIAPAPVAHTRCSLE